MMAIQNPNVAVARSNLTLSNTSSTEPNSRGSATHQRPVIDLLVAMIAVPILILCALQLEKNLHEMANSPESRWLVFALGIGMLIVSVIICGYVTHRMGVCIWAGPIDEAGNRVHGRIVPHINSQNDILRFVDTMPPSYDSVVKFDIPPPSYDCLVIDMEHQYKEEHGSSTSMDKNGDADDALVMTATPMEPEAAQATAPTTTSPPSTVEALSSPTSSSVITMHI